MTPFSSVSIDDFEQVKVNWVQRIYFMQFTWFHVYIISIPQKWHDECCRLEVFYKKTTAQNFVNLKESICGNISIACKKELLFYRIPENNYFWKCSSNFKFTVSSLKRPSNSSFIEQLWTWQMRTQKRTALLLLCNNLSIMFTQNSSGGCFCIVSI